ncbi:MAG: arylesterase [Bdellovibrionales bacterium CG12_big_fil_rev_8_21_14_0_65_38_15]|nr:MAG: arylesterase [Bdellovibrionales bacterium CG22_combo_CG10-13_8_21_14_all_38_13]PIQ53209.1 MAG: arylesterase [Bdellovibrionales bacterium CG12_big_fil_rev_8_21_14_0_65_38_15]PIR29622.1 MAG: arylesterase [Bdellovibrionales bacterium CG11_big_fil_rev_8_21_14_0_20_38_13]
MGDSLSEGYGVSREKAFPSIIKQQLEADELGFKVKVTNGSVSGSTSANAPSRLKWFLKSKPDVLVLALGANDGLRGIDVESSSKNLAQTIALAKENNIRIVLTGMLIPPNYGEEYRKKFSSMYDKLKTKYQLDFIPFLLEGVAGIKEYNQADGIHPNVKGHEVLAKNVMKILRPILISENDKRKGSK